MKSITKLLLSLFIIIFMGNSNTLFAQSIDNNRMNRDINIMENILQEMFKTNVKGSANSVRTSTFAFSGSNNIRGTHLPDYGIIFSIPGTQRRFVTINSENDDDNRYAYVFRYSDDNDEGDKVNQENIILRIKEFLREYGSTIGQLQGDDKIMVIYNSRAQSNAVTFFSSSGMKVNSDKLPTISVVISRSDLNEFRSGAISEAELDKRYSVSIVEEDGKNQLDLKVMANIFETALKDSEKESFRIRGDVSYLKLNNFGAVFSMTVSYGNSGYLVRSLELAEMSARSFGVVRSKADSNIAVTVREKAKQLEEEKEKTQQAEKEAYQKFLMNIKEYLVDYGRTLSSVSSDQYLLISTTLSSRVDDIPERVDFQVKKSVLEAIDNGSMKRDQAINQITVREY